MTFDNPGKPVVIVDDEGEAFKSYSLALESDFITNIVHLRDSREVLPFLQEKEAEIVLLDLLMPFMSGKELLGKIITEFPGVPVIILTAVDELETAVECMRAGAFDYMVKPVERSRLLSGIKRAIDMRELKRENFLLRKHFFSDTLDNPEVFSEIVTNNALMKSIFKYIDTIGKTTYPVLISGETGSGKELVAKALHKKSGRSGRMVSVNIAGLDDNIFSDTLFGHRKGAFTGADTVRSGLIEQAHNGSLFLDEIGDLTMTSQTKLLRLVQEGEYFPLGSDVPKKTNARIIAATNKDLAELMEQGSFRKDLFYRITPHQIDLPPLRRRLDDLAILLNHFIHETAEQLGKQEPKTPHELITLLSNYHFPGNIRELQGMIFNAVSMHDKGVISLDPFRKAIERRSGKEGGPYRGRSTSSSELLDMLGQVLDNRFPQMKEVESLFIDEAIKRSKGNQSIAAGMLGISRPTLINRLKSKKLPDTD
ncbi:MAG: sigma-54-dependent transcriptional regulator [Nitrospinota bacterium]